MLERTIRSPHTIDLTATVAPLAHGDGSVRLGRDSVDRAVVTPDGPASQRIEASGGEVRVEAWGPGASWLLESAPSLIGCRDDADGFEPKGVLRDLHRARPGLRIGATSRVFETLVPTILGQKVTTVAARRAMRKLVADYGSPAPGPLGLRLPPTPDRIVEIPYWEWHALGVERRRAETIRFAASCSSRLEGAPDADRLRHMLEALPGVGPWTVAKTMRVVTGDADAVETGDFHIPNTIAWVLAREERGDDARMLELLEPYRGHRGRVVRIVCSSGRRAPARGPRVRVASLPD
ncbi:MAG TPA: DNA-3-methyladenine glycosylase 2 family protein [Actinomycetota bacterium]|nr:DNA-3-methyladenine glycosylase 2 family protein [Actinomycetota bacterium]